MLDNVPVTLEHYLVAQQTRSLRALAHAALRKFSIDILVKLKFTTKNFQSGFDFVDAYFQDSELVRLLKIVARNFYKAIPWSKAVDTYTTSLYYVWPFLQMKNNRIIITTTRDPVVIRIASKINRDLFAMNIPLKLVEASSVDLSQRISFPNVLPAMDDGVETPIRLALTRINNSRGAVDFTNIYKVLFLLPKVILLLKIMHRKAVFHELRIRQSSRSYIFTKIINGTSLPKRPINF